MKLSLFDYQLPIKLIAQFPQRRRDQSRLMVLDRSSKSIEHRRFSDIVEYLREGDALVINTTKVFKARLIGNRESGGEVEIFLVRLIDTNETWEALARPTRRLKAGERILFDNSLWLELVSYSGDGRWLVRFPSESVRKRVVSRHGQIPLPQYIDRTSAPADIRRYQTTYADPKKCGAVAAPTAGFHFSKSLLGSIEQKGVKVVRLTLHVGPGTFRPVQTENIHNHRVDPEQAELPATSAKTLNAVRKNGGRVFAVGTTSVRTLESAEVVSNMIQPYKGAVDLFVKPGYEFRLVDHLVTNFHLPKSSLLLLVSAFAGRETVLKAYAEAIEREYRFYSYGDAMLIL